jgi:iron complex outermembrane receptor protein
MKMFGSRKWILRHVLLTATVAFHPIAEAQEETGEALTEITVTGSRIARSDVSTVGPVTTLTLQDIEAAVPLSVGELLQELPGAGVSLNGNGTQGTSYGVSAVNLRYLGSSEGSGNRVLVLVDGHRWINAAGGRGFRDFVDLNTIPLGMVESIEVLKDGASAIYGADAIAGVVNIRTRKSVEGVEARLTYGETSKSDGASLSASLNVGHRVGRLSGILSLSYVDSDPILTTDRSLTALASAPVTSPPNSPRGLYVLPGISTSSSPLTRLEGAAGSSPADFRTARLPDDFYNTLAQGLYSVGPSRRIGVFGRLSYELSEDTQAHLELLFNDRDSSQLFSPLSIDVRQNQGFTIPADHPFNPWQRAFTSSSLRIRRFPIEVGNRNNVQNVETQRIALRLEGKVDWGSTWTWDLFASKSENEATFAGFNQINYDNLALSLGSNERCVANQCVPLNIFGQITPAMADYIRFNGFDENGTEQSNFAINVSARPWALPAGSVGVAAGVEWREESAYDRPDAFASSTPEFVTTARRRTSFATRDATIGKYDLWEGYVELDVPVLADLPAVHSLDINAAARYSDYSSFGDATTTKLGISWRPIASFLIRGTASEGFRAPSILELYQGSRQTTFQAVDPCNGGGAGLPGCAGVPNGYNQNQFGSGTLRGVIGGNSSLKAETSDTLTAGIAWTPSVMDGLSFTGDWWKIRIDDAIASQTAQQILTLCANRAGVFCANVSRDPTLGEVVELRQSVVNFNRIEVEGLDLTLRQDLEVLSGQLSIVVDASRLFHFTTFAPQADGSVVVTERAGQGDTPRATFPKWKGQVGLQWRNDIWNTGWRSRYIGDATDVAGNPINGGRTAATWYHDLQIGRQLGDNGTRLTLGIENVFDKMPPASRANSPINYDIYTYDARGRYMFVKLAADF